MHRHDRFDRGRDWGINEQRKYAYRWLLYRTLLDIRPLERVGRGWRQRLNPAGWWTSSRQVRVAGGLADWLHNLVLFSALDFDQFDEGWFWKDHQFLLDQYPGSGLEWYRAEFEQHVPPVAAPGDERGP